MKISQLNNSSLKKFGEAELSSGNEKALWNINWNKSLEKDLLRKTKYSRVYIIAVGDPNLKGEEEIYKIGASEDASGFKGTFGAYRNCGNSGRPSDRTHGIHIFIAEQLLLGKSVVFYGYFGPQLQCTIPTIYGTMVRKTITPPAKILEHESVSEYLTAEGKYPAWNLQEAHKSWPIHITNGLNDLKKNKKSVTLQEIKQRLGIK